MERSRCGRILLNKTFYSLTPLFLKDTINVLFIGDIIGEPGFNITKSLLPSFKTKYKTDFVIANAENITEGMGTLEKDAKALLALGNRCPFRR